MGGLYNTLFGHNPACVFIAPMLTDKNPEKFFPRFRDCWVSDDGERIEVFTRVGGGNREYYDEEIEALRAMPTYVKDYDDDFDCTYATFVFDVPDEWKPDFDALIEKRFADVSSKYVSHMQKCYQKLNIRDIMEKLVERSEELSSDGGDE